jgi:hypothetical protein
MISDQHLVGLRISCLCHAFYITLPPSNRNLVKRTRTYYTGPWCLPPAPCSQTPSVCGFPQHKRPIFTPLDWLIVMGWECVSELQPPTGLLFIPRVTCEHGQPWWSWCRIWIAPGSYTRALWQSYQQRHVRKVGGMSEGVRILPISIWNTSRDL